MSDLHHLLRVRMRKVHFDKLKTIAEKETQSSGEYTSVSDIVRTSILNWIQTYESQQRLEKLFVPPSQARAEARTS